MTRLLRRQRGVSYPLGYVLVAPFYLTVMLFAVEAGFLMFAQLGTHYAAHTTRIHKTDRGGQSGSRWSAGTRSPGTGRYPSSSSAELNRILDRTAADTWMANTH